MAYRFRNPDTGGTGEIEDSKVGEALKRGMQPLDPIAFYNPETEGTGDVPAAKAAEAMQRGLLPVGSHEHQLATTSKLESFGRGAAQGASFGFADELAGLLKSALGPQTYQQARDEYRQNDATAAEANPITSTLGNLGGAVATSFVPGLGQIGAVQKGAGILDVAKAGMQAGALAGLGSSQADLTKGQIGQAATDTIEGGLVGGAGSAVMHGVGKGLYAAGDAVRRGVGRFFDPTINRLQASGATMKNIKQAGGLEELVGSVQHANERGIWGENERGLLPTPKETFGRVEAALDQDVGQMRNLVGNTTEALTSDDMTDAWFNHMKPKLDQLVKEADPMEADNAKILIDKLQEQFTNTGGDIQNLWDLKKLSGGWANWNKDTPALNQIKKVFNQDLNQLVVGATNDIAEKMNIPDLAKLNESYSHLVKLRDYLGQTVDKELYAGGPGNVQMKDYVRGSAIGAGIGAVTGFPIVGGAAGVAAMGVGAGIRSTSGRLARAKVGEMMNLSAEGLQQKVAANAQAAAQGMIPRTLSGMKQWAQQNAAMIPPQYMPAIQNIMRMPDSAAEIEVRMMMPMIQQMMAPSAYQSEFNGKITSPQDRMTATQVIKAQGLPPSIAAYHQSLLNKSGTLQPYHFAAQQEDYGDQLLDFNNRLTQMGY